MFGCVTVLLIAQLQAGHLTLWIGPLRRITHVYNRNQTPASLSCEAIWSMPEARALPRSPEQLLEELFAMFPQYRAEYTDPIHDETPTFHSVLIGFSSFRLASSSEAQLRAFGELVSAAVAAGGPLANAFETCLLEHLHQIGADRALRPYLSKTVRERSRA